MVNYTRLACMLRTYRKCNPMVGFSKYEINNKLLSGVTFFSAGHKMPLYVSFLRHFSQLWRWWHGVPPPLYVSFLRRFFLVIAVCWTAAIDLLNFPQNFALLFTSSLLLGFLSYLFPFPTYSKLSLSPNFCRCQLSPNCTSDPSPSFTPTTLHLPFAPVTLHFPSLFLHQPQHHRPQ